MQRLRYVAVHESEDQRRPWCVKNGEFYVCEIIPLGPREEQELAELIARLLNEEDTRSEGAKQPLAQTAEEMPL